MRVATSPIRSPRATRSNASLWLDHKSSIPWSWYTPRSSGATQSGHGHSFSGLPGISSRCTRRESLVPTRPK